VAAREAAETRYEDLHSQFHKVQTVLEAREESLESTRRRLEEAEAALDACRVAHHAEMKRAEVAESSLAGSRNEVETLEARIAVLKRSNGDLGKQVLDLKVALAGGGTKAVADYKASELYRRDVAEASIDAFLKGFKDFHQQVVQKYPDLDFSSFEPIFC
jgi:chromosome segregation ATPase